LGDEFKPTQKFALRAGYNYGKSPIRGGVKNTDEDLKIAMFNQPNRLPSHHGALRNPGPWL